MQLLTKNYPILRGGYICLKFGHYAQIPGLLKSITFKSLQPKLWDLDKDHAKIIYSLELTGQFICL